MKIPSERFVGVNIEEGEAPTCRVCYEVEFPNPAGAHNPPWLLALTCLPNDQNVLGLGLVFRVMHFPETSALSARESFILVKGQQNGEGLTTDACLGIQLTHAIAYYAGIKDVV